MMIEMLEGREFMSVTVMSSQTLATPTSTPIYSCTASGIGRLIQVAQEKNDAANVDAQTPPPPPPPPPPK